jgi:NADH-quinone oxidoreductase subunit E
MPISDATREEADRLVRRYPVARSALLPLLHLVQADEGYVSEDGIAFCAEVLALTKAEVGAVATFYTMYKREPFGDYLLSVCTNPTCKIAGAQAIYEAYVEACGGKHVDPDGAGVMVEHAECLGICDAAPVVQINYEMYGPVTHDEAMDLFAKAKAGDPPASNRSGQVPPTFRGVEREFSGIDDGVDEYLIEAARLQAMATVPPSYRSGETDIPVTHPGGDPSGHGGEVFRAAAQPVTVTVGGADADDGSTAAGGDDVTSDQDRTFERRESTQRAVERLAAEGRGVEQELAAAATGDAPTEPTPAAEEQPPVDEGPATPDAAQEGTPAGVEDEPSDSVAGTAGPDEELEEPTADVPAAAGVPGASRAADRTPDGGDGAAPGDQDEPAPDGDEPAPDGDEPAPDGDGDGAPSEEA